MRLRTTAVLFSSLMFASQVFAAETSPNPAPTADPYASLKISSGGQKSLKSTADDEINSADKISNGQAPKKKTKSKKTKVAGPAPYDASEATGTRAAAELVPQKVDQSSGVLPTPGTVRSAIGPVKSPVARAAFEVSVSVQSYKPAGMMKLPAMDTFDLGSIPAGPMVELDVRWFALRFATAQPLDLGPYLSVGYAQLAEKLYTPAGAPISKTQLQFLKAEAGGSLGWQPSDYSLWGARFELGGGELTETQASTSTFANHSASVAFVSAGIYGERRLLDHVGVSLGYAYRAPVHGEPDEITLQRSNFLAGVTGSFQ